MVNVADRDNNLYRVYFEASQYEEQEKWGLECCRYKELEGYENSKLIVNTTKRLSFDQTSRSAITITGRA